VPLFDASEAPRRSTSSLGMPMLASATLQIISACCGVLGSIFFAIGVMRQSAESMANLAGTYFDWNPHMVPALAAQKADYLFGGGIILLAFLVQLLSVLLPQGQVAATAVRTSLAAWLAVASTVGGFFVLRFASKALAKHFEGQINHRLNERLEEQKKELVARQVAAPN
jgi:hypothetical protein